MVARIRCPIKRRDENLRYKYGVTLDWYNAQYEKQKGACAICGAEQDTLCVDHCHSTGKVRGLLCSECNKGLGAFGDCSVSLRRAASYLEEGRLPLSRNPDVSLFLSMSEGQSITVKRKSCISIRRRSYREGWKIKTARAYGSDDKFKITLLNKGVDGGETNQST